MLLMNWKLSVFVLEPGPWPYSAFFKMGFLGVYLGPTNLEEINNIQNNVKEINVIGLQELVQFERRIKFCLHVLFKKKKLLQVCHDILFLIFVF